ncbi:MAG: hypothetical protein AMXMBFR58_24860 [Phycisphaerae bacterium]
MKPSTLVLRALVTAAIAATSLVACTRNTSPSLPPRSSVAVKSYTVKGVIEAMPAADRPGSQFIVRHEEIPDFVRQDGTLGMKKMAMPFPLGPGVTLDGLSVGDAIEFDFTVDWNATPSWWVTAIRPTTQPPQ